MGKLAYDQDKFKDAAREFAVALSLAVPNMAVDAPAITDLIRAALSSRKSQASDRGVSGITWDAMPGSALDELEETLERVVPNARDRQAVWDLCARVARDATAEQKGGAMLEARSAATSRQPGKAENYGVAQRSERPDGRAEDERPSPLAAILAGVKAPRWIAGR
jgi:hypothetical protein